MAWKILIALISTSVLIFSALTYQPVTYEIYVRPVLAVFGRGRPVIPVGNTDCKTVPELKACEKIVLHQPTGIIYLACSTPESRTHWLPTMNFLNAPGRSEDDYVATYDPATGRISHFTFSGHPNTARGMSLHGMDVVPSAADPSVLFVYLVNHRVPLERDAREVGADSVIEIFKTTLDGDVLTYVTTMDDPSVIITPNDIVGSSDGKSFHFTNDHGVRVGTSRIYEKFGYADTSVGYCHVDEGCKIAISKMHANNGIAKSPNNDTFYVGCGAGNKMSILERQEDNSLVLTEVVSIDRFVDNVSVDASGQVWLSGFPDPRILVRKHYVDPRTPCPSSALRVSINRGPGAFYGDKYRVDKVFEDDGMYASGSTSAVYDSERGILFMHGVASPQLAVCRV